MRIVNLHHPYEPQDIIQEPIVLALGFFDGVHKGHQSVIAKAKKMAEEKKLPMALMTFDRHPGVVFEKYETLRPCYLTSLEEKKKLLNKFGVDILYIVNFTSAFASLSPQQFIDEYIVGLHAKVAVAGFDYTYGKKEIANMDKLPDYAKGRFEIVRVGQLKQATEKISSSIIKNKLLSGKIKEANKMLGYPYSTPGFVINGEARGRELGYRTANIQTEYPVCIPKIGVYAVRMEINGQVYDGMASIGYNITFGDRDTCSVEVHLFDFDQEIYGENVLVKWIAYLREEKKFSSIETLVEQLKQDERDARSILQNEQK